MSEVHAPPKLHLGTAYLIGNIVLLLPSLTRAVLGELPWSLALYLAAASAGMQLVALAVLHAVHRRAFARGISVRATALVSLLAAYPAVLMCSLIDEVVASRWPALSTVPAWTPHSLSSMLLTSASDAAAASVLIAAVVYLPAMARAHRDRNRELQLVRHEAELLRARAQLEPHFVLNTLNAVAGLVEDEPTQARDLLAALGDLFRDATALREQHSVAAEFEWLRRYVAIHELRYPDRLHVTWSLDPHVAQHSLPALLSQPLVENAIKHGALRGDGHLSVRAWGEGAQLCIQIEDGGPELGGPRPGGRGVAITRRRIELAELPASAFVLQRQGTRTVATLTLPLQPEGKRADAS